MRILIPILLISLSYPCSCTEPPPPEEAYEDADVVFSGLVTNIVLDDSGYYYEVTFQVIDVWKGEGFEEITVLTETYSDTCGYYFQINYEYLVYAYNYNWGIYTNICTRTNLLEYASEDLEYLNGLNFSTVTDIDGNIYETVLLGEQLWMAENLKVTHYRNGDEIPFPPTNDGWCCDENGDYDPLNEIGQYGFIDYDPQNAEIYANHYNWFAVDDIRGICPEGWHVPTDDEWTILITHLDEDADPEGMGVQSYIAGGKMKSTGTLEGEDGLWYAPNYGATNESGFTGLPGGDRIYGNGVFSVMHVYGDFWSSTGASGIQDSNAYSRYLYHWDSSIYRGMYEKNYGFSVRCLANDYILGDINGDEILNVLDIVLMINMILSNGYSVVADVNEDGSVDILDVVIMVNILVGGLP